MIDHESGPRREDTTNDQSLDRGYGGLPGKRPDEEFGEDEDTVTRQPAKDRLPPRERDRGDTRH
jgi:hypothetical protein